MLPDWKDDASYEYTQALNSQGWAWEFLRRNKGYRADYIAFATLKNQVAQEFGPIQSWNKSVLQECPAAWYHEPAKYPEETVKAWKVRAIVAGVEPYRALIHIGFARKWGLEEMVDPDKGAEQGVHFLPAEAPPIWYRAEQIEVDSRFTDDEEGLPIQAFARIDLTRSITDQTTALRKTLNREQKRLRKEGLVWRTSVHAGKHRIYLRILDAFDTGNSSATAKSVGAVVFPKIDDEYPAYSRQERVRDTHKQANQLVAGGYLRMVHETPD